MTQESKLTLSRRKLLGSLSAVGLASAGAGLGTTAYFSDEESFTNNTFTAGELDLAVDYFSSVDQGTTSSSTSGELNGSTYSFEIDDVKPGDSGTLAFCPKLIDNAGWLWVGSESGLTDFENGLSDPEMAVDSTGGDPGEGNGELGDAIDVTVSYCENVSLSNGSVTADEIRELNNPSEYTLGDLGSDLNFGFLLDGDTGTSGIQPYPSSTGSDDQAGPCLCIEWDVPTDVGNEIQTDSIELGVQFQVIQRRHNPDPVNPFATGTGFSEISFEKALNMQALARGGSGRGEIQIHGDSGGVEDNAVFGSAPYPTNTDIDFTAEIDPTSSPPTASLTVNGVTVTDDDVTDGDANGASTGDPEWPGGVPSLIDVALNANSASGNGVTTVIKGIEINGNPTSPATIQSSGGASYLGVTNVDSSGVVTISGTMEFQGAQADLTSQDWIGIDFR